MWGLLMVAIGIFFVASAWSESEFVVYRLFVARARRVWGESVHRYLLMCGVAIVIAGGALAIRDF